MRSLAYVNIKYVFLPLPVKMDTNFLFQKYGQGHIQRLFGHSGFYWQSDKM